MAHTAGKLARLTSVRSELEAGIMVSGLEDRGIRAVMSGVFTTSFRAEAPGWVEVLVAEEDLAKAEATLAAIKDERGSIDWSQVDVGQPDDE